MARNIAPGVSRSKLRVHFTSPMIIPTPIWIQQAFGEPGHTPGGGGLVGKISGILQVEGLNYASGSSLLTRLPKLRKCARC